MALNVENITHQKYSTFIQCFEENVENDKKLYVCCVEMCRKSYCDKSGAIRHLRINHKDIFEVIKESKSGDLINSQFSALDIRVKVIPEEIINACVNLIAVNGLSISFVEYPAFQKILHPYITALGKNGINLVINRHNMVKHIQQKAIHLKEKIKLRIKNKVLHLMVDIASRYNRSILGINISYMIDGKINIDTIGMHPLRFSHTAENIVRIITQNLLEYDIRMEQIFSVTSDNGRNIIKAVSLLDQRYQEQKEKDDDDLLSNEEYIDPDIFDENYYENILNQVRASFDGANTTYTDMIFGISCAAHCLHLVVTHAIEKTGQIGHLLGKCRAVAKKLRTPSMRTLLRSAGHNMMILDIETRWNSIFSMVIYLTFNLSISRGLQNLHE